MPVDFTTDIGKVRALVPDIQEVDWSSDGTASFLFPDEHIEALLEINDDNIHRAAADAAQAVAGSEALISKVIRTEDLQTDGAKVANAFLVHARQLRQEADRAEEREDQSAFDIIGFHHRNPYFVWPR